jgi:hypothetical protein
MHCLLWIGRVSQQFYAIRFLEHLDEVTKGQWLIVDHIDA